MSSVLLYHWLSYISYCTGGKWENPTYIHLNNKKKGEVVDPGKEYLNRWGRLQVWAEHRSSKNASDHPLFLPRPHFQGGFFPWGLPMGGCWGFGHLAALCTTRGENLTFPWELRGGKSWASPTYSSLSLPTWQMIASIHPGLHQDPWSFSWFLSFLYPLLKSTSKSYQLHLQRVFQPLVSLPALSEPLAPFTWTRERVTTQQLVSLPTLLFSPNHFSMLSHRDHFQMIISRTVSISD